MSERGSSAGAFLVGLAVGAVLGFLFAPEAGEDTRRALSRRLRDLRDVAEEKGGELLDGGVRQDLVRRLQAARQRRRGEDEPTA